jgi:hypothetical protein
MMPKSNLDHIRNIGETVPHCYEQKVNASEGSPKVDGNIHYRNEDFATRKLAVF